MVLTRDPCDPWKEVADNGDQEVREEEVREGGYGVLVVHEETWPDAFLEVGHVIQSLEGQEVPWIADDVVEVLVVHRE